VTRRLKAAAVAHLRDLVAFVYSVAAVEVAETDGHDLRTIVADARHVRQQLVEHVKANAGLSRSEGGSRGKRQQSDPHRQPRA
jgi:hypothetical protein